jgi:hypothetical protein
MMTILLSVLGAFATGGAAFVAHSLITAPEGSQDDKGFHYSKKPASRRMERHAISSGAAMHRA